MIRCGIDMVDIAKFEEVFRRHPDFAGDVFSPHELAYCSVFRNPFPHLASHFAAKEAGLKALEIGIRGPGIDRSLREIEVLAGSGSPKLALGGWPARVARATGVGSITVTTSFNRRYALAAVILG